MMKISIGTKIGLGYGCALILLMIVGVTTYQNVSHSIENATWVARTHSTIGELHHVILRMENAEAGLRGYLLSGDESYLDHYSNMLASIDKDMADVTESAKDTNFVDVVAQIQSAVSNKCTFMKEELKLKSAGGAEGLTALFKAGKGEKVSDDLRALVDSIIAGENKLLASREKEAEADDSLTINVVRYGSLIALVVLSILGIAITLNITRPVKNLVEVANAIGAGNLTLDARDTGRHDEIGVLTRSFNLMISNLRSQIREILDGVGVLASSASEISTTVSQLAASATETASSVSETTSTVEEVKKTAELAREKSRTVAEGARETAKIAQTGEDAVRATGESMARIREQVDSVAASMVKLSEQSQAIGMIISSVDDIAEQSNLLAVNAAIEAAKAGEQGRGFSVVAQEVKNLAEQSKQATAQVRTILNDIQRATSTAVMATEQAGNAVNGGFTQSTRTGEAIQILARNSQSAAEASSQIAVSAQQQFAGVDQVTIAMENIKQASEQNVEGTRQMELAAQNLDTLGRRLKELVGKYQV
jgi:methyl-accepting chemotaxis protein